MELLTRPVRRRVLDLRLQSQSFALKRIKGRAGAGGCWRLRTALVVLIGLALLAGVGWVALGGALAG